MSRECGGGDGWVAPYLLKSVRFGCVFYLWKFKKKSGKIPLERFGWFWVDLSWINVKQHKQAFSWVFGCPCNAEWYWEHSIVCVFTNLYPHTHNTRLERERWDTKQTGFVRVGRIYQVLCDGVDVWVKVFPGSCCFPKSASCGGRVNGSENVFEQTWILC